MSGRINEDLADMKKKLSEYVEKGRLIGYREASKEPAITLKPAKSKIKPLKKVKRCNVHFMAVDCSTRTLKRANNWGIYLFRAAYAMVRGRDVSWGYEERMCTAIGDAYDRSNLLKDIRLELESEMALRVLKDEGAIFYDDHKDSRRKYLLLDGSGYFGGQRKFRVSLFDACKNAEIILLTVSKRSPMLHDDRGRDFVATTTILSPYPIWVYYPAEKANKDKHLYGDVSVIKLCEDSGRAFRCDIMEYLTGHEISELLSPLTFTSEDPRCLGYPIPLWLAHDFSRPSDSMLLHYYAQVEEALANAGLQDRLRREEFSCNFSDTLHGIRFPYEQELIEYV